MFGICLLEIRGLFTKWATFPFLIKNITAFLSQRRMELSLFVNYRNILNTTLVKRLVTVNMSNVYKIGAHFHKD